MRIHYSPYYFFGRVNELKDKDLYKPIDDIIKGIVNLGEEGIDEAVKIAVESKLVRDPEMFREALIKIRRDYLDINA